MADVRVREVDDALSGLLEILGVFVDCRNPSERLVWWRNVVAMGRKDDDWIPDPPEVSSATLANLERPCSSWLPMNRFSTIARISSRLRK